MDNNFIKEVEELYQKVVNSDTNIFSEVAEIAGLDPKTDFIGANLAGTDFRGSNLDGYNFTKANLSNCNFNGVDLSKVRFN